MTKTKYKEFDNNDELVYFINENNIKVVSTHLSPLNHQLTTGGNYQSTRTLRNKVTLLYLDIKRKKI